MQTHFFELTDETNTAMPGHMASKTAYQLYEVDKYLKASHLWMPGIAMEQDSTTSMSHHTRS